MLKCGSILFLNCAADMVSVPGFIYKLKNQFAKIKADVGLGKKSCNSHSFIIIREVLILTLSIFTALYGCIS